MVKQRVDRCWEQMRCGFEIECAAFPDCGHKCWEVAGTLRNSASEKRQEKLYNLAREKGRDLTEKELTAYHPAKPKLLCKFIERYGMCQCCPYYQHMEQMEKDRKAKNQPDW